MVTFKPVKKWLIPILAAVAGTLIGYSFLPSHQEYAYQQWVGQIDEMEQMPFQLITHYEKEESPIFNSKGYWSKEGSHFTIVTPVSDESEFEFDIFLREKEFFVLAGGEWKKGSYPHRIIDELSPLDDPFQWSKVLLKEADEISKETQGDKVTYKAGFHSFKDYEFQGVLLKEQKETSLTMVFQKGVIHSILFEATPRRPEEVPLLNSYPKNLTFLMEFSRINREIQGLPAEAFSGEVLD